MHDFAYVRATSIDEAVAALRDAEDAKIVAGGMTLLPAMKLSLAAPSTLVDLAALDELRGIQDQGDHIMIGAMTCHAAVAASPVVRGTAPVLAALAAGIGDVQVRNRGTIGGSVSNNDPSADYPAACLALDARLRTTKRELAAEDFFDGFYSTVLDPDEVLLSLDFPKTRRGAYRKLRSQASGYALAGVLVAATEAGARVAVTGAGNDGVFRLRDAEEALDKHFAVESVADVRIPVEDMMRDSGCSAEYRAHIVGVLMRRAVDDVATGQSA